MILNLKILTVALLSSTVLIGQTMAARTKGEDGKHMNKRVELVWTAIGEKFDDRRQVDFMFSPGHGLTDIDFHSITAREWPAMRSPTVDSVAMLQVVKGTPIEQVEEVIRQIADKGGYQTVVVTIGQ